jgi:hypothetical protein
MKEELKENLNGWKGREEIIRKSHFEPILKWLKMERGKEEDE